MQNFICVNIFLFYFLKQVLKSRLYVFWSIFGAEQEYGGHLLVGLYKAFVLVFKLCHLNSTLA